MSYWSEVKDVALKGVDLALSNFKATAEQAIEKGKDGVTYLQLKKDLFMGQRNLQVFLADLGDITNELYKSKSDIAGNLRVKEAVDKIAAAEEKCRSIEAEMKKISGK
ncbi:MAG TPA: hypothetical protein PK514_03615 [Spirochaetota bacterium]|nr:hypothetical protein [Spirochaetota bacterium]